MLRIEELYSLLLQIILLGYQSNHPIKMFSSNKSTVFMLSENMENTSSKDTAGGDSDKGAGAGGGEPVEIFPAGRLKLRYMRFFS